MNDPRQRAPFAHQRSSADLSTAYASSNPLRPLITSPIEDRGGAPLSSGGLSNTGSIGSVISGSNIGVGSGSGSTGGPAYFEHNPPSGTQGVAASTSSSIRTTGGNSVAGTSSAPSSAARARFDDRGYPAYGPGSGHHYHHHHHHHHYGGSSYSLNTPPSTRSILPNVHLNLNFSAFDFNTKFNTLLNTFTGSFSSFFSSSSSGTAPDSPQPMRMTPATLQNVRFVALCSLWYASSAVSSNTGKVILMAFKFPVTLTIVQFAFVAALCWLGSRRQLGWTGRLRKPTKAILLGTLPMAGFQVGGHIFSSLAISRVPVSTVHTIKALSPLFTVLAYAVLFGVSYSPATYIALLPLTVGVMLACTFDLSISNFFGLLCAFGSTMIFVSQNIFFKKIMPSPGTAHSGESSTSPRLDKVNLLYFSSGLAFILMIPIWLYTDAFRLLDLWLAPAAYYASSKAAIVSASAYMSAPRITLYFVINGVVHFLQNVLAFAILSSTSPVTYSIASLVKRIAVICMAIVWFKQAVHPVQAVGIALTGLGLYLYNGAKRDVDRGEKKVRQVEASREGLLPSTRADQRILEGRTPSPEPVGLGFSVPVQSLPPQSTIIQSTNTKNNNILSVPPPSTYQPTLTTSAHSTATQGGYHQSYVPAALSLSSNTIASRPGYAASITPVISSTGLLSNKSTYPKTQIVHGTISTNNPNEPPYPSPPASTSSSPPGGPVMGLSKTDDVRPLALAAGA